jgi:hypothetical protein
MLEPLETRTKNSRKIRFETRIRIRKSNHERGIAQHRAAHATVSQRGKLGAAGRFAHQRVHFSRNFGLKSERLCCLSVFVIYFHCIFKKIPTFNGTKESY